MCDEKTAEDRQMSLELAMMHAEDHQDRKQYEWKVFFGLWAGLALVIYYLLSSQIELPRTICCFLSTVQLVILFTTVFLVVLPLRRSYRRNRLWQRYYEQLASGADLPQADKAPPADVSYWHGFKSPWAWAQILVTAVLVACGIVTVWSCRLAFCYPGPDLIR